MHIEWNRPDIQAAIVGAVIGVIATAISTYLLIVLPERHKWKAVAAEYLRSMASALEGMADSFERGEIPTVGGNQLFISMSSFQAKTSKALGQRTEIYAAKVKDLADRAEHEDLEIR